MIPYYITVSYPSSMHPGPDITCPCVDVTHGILNEHKVGWFYELLEKLVNMALEHNQRFEISGFSGEHLMYPVRKYKTYKELVDDLYPNLSGKPFTCHLFTTGEWNELNYSDVQFMEIYNKTNVI
jgi:hypothetical protein